MSLTKVDLSDKMPYLDCLQLLLIHTGVQQDEEDRGVTHSFLSTNTHVTVNKYQDDTVYCGNKRLKCVAFFSTIANVNLQHFYLNIFFTKYSMYTI